MVAQWDDHEVLNNWYPTEMLGTDRQRGELPARSTCRCSRRGREQAFFDYAPIRAQPPRPAADLSPGAPRPARGRVRPRLPHLPRPELRQPAAAGGAGHGDARARRSVAWLESALAASTATWKIVACDQPIGLVVARRAAAGGLRQRRPEGAGPRARSRGAARGAEAPRDPQRDLRHRRRPLRGGAPLRSGEGDLHRLRSVLGVRRRPAPRRHLRPEPRSTRRSDRRPCSPRSRRSRTGRRATTCSSSGRSTIDPATQRRHRHAARSRDGKPIYTNDPPACGGLGVPENPW